MDSSKMAGRLLGHVPHVAGLLLLAVGFASGVCLKISNERCRCPPGTAGNECQFSLRNLYGSEADSVYDWHPRHLDMRGWNMRPDLYERLARNVSAQFIAEVGVWKGASTIAMAKYLKVQGHGAIVAVDTFLGSLEMWRRIGEFSHPDFDLELHRGYPTIFYTFLSNVMRSGVKDYVIPFPVPSKVAAEFFFAENLQFDLLHIDAAHEFDDVLRDLQLWWQNLRPGGIMMGDDINGGWPGVDRAVATFAAEHGLPYETDGYKWWIMKPEV